MKTVFFASVLVFGTLAQGSEWQTKNFVIQSVDANQGVYLEKNIEKIKTWILTRWGLEDFDFPTKRVISLDGIAGKPTEVIPALLTPICLEEYGKKYKHVPYWAVRGMTVLNGSYPQIKTKIKSFQIWLTIDKPIYTSKSLLQVGSPENQELFDVQSSIMVLLLFKEYKPEFHEFLFTRNLTLLGFSSHDEMNLSFVNYSKRLGVDLAFDKTPDSYLQIK
jgi:hypothetical protein